MKFFTHLILMLALCLACAAAEAQSADMLDFVGTADEALSLAKTQNVTVFEDLRLTHGGEAWNDFYASVLNGESSEAVLAYYHTLDETRVSPELYAEEKDNYPALYIYRVVFDGEMFWVYTRGSLEAEFDEGACFRYLMHYTGDAPAQALFSVYDNYILVDDDTVSYDDIWRGMISSRM